jgi:hypothetical protein
MLERYLMAEPKRFELVALGLPTRSTANSPRNHIMEMEDKLETIMAQFSSAPEQFSGSGGGEKDPAVILNNRV